MYFLFQFFEPLVPTRIDLHMDSLGRITGTANVYFSSNQDVTEALKKDYHYMGETEKGGRGGGGKVGLQKLRS